MKYITIPFKHGKVKDFKINFDLFPGLGSARGKCSYCNNDDELLSVDTIVIHKIVSEHKIMTSPTLKKLLEARLRGHLRVHKRRYCIKLTCEQKHMEELPRLLDEAKVKEI